MASSSARESIIVFTDGAAKGNPGPGGWGAIIVAPDGHVVELGGGAAHTTNNKMELTGAISALERIAGVPGPLVIYTDSSYVINGITQWVWGWRRRGWKTVEGGDVLNRDLWERLSALVDARGARQIAWKWLRGHNGTPGNERVDQIAVAFAQRLAPALYDGPLDSYDVPVLDLPEETAVPSRTTNRGPAPGAKSVPYSYLSVVDGVLERHQTWADCERRVKGRSGARFKKAASAAEETAILRDWGFAT